MGDIIDISGIGGYKRVSVTQVSWCPEVYVHIDDVDRDIKSQRRYYKCDVCNDIFEWNEDSISIEHSIVDNRCGYDVMFIVCSLICRSQSKDDYVKWLVKYPGWTKQKAEKWFNENCKDFEEIPASKEEILAWKIKNKDTEVQRAYAIANDKIKQSRRDIVDAEKRILLLKKEIEQNESVLNQCIQRAAEKGYGTEIFSGL